MRQPFYADGLVIGRTDNREPRVVEAEDFGQDDLHEVVMEEVGGRGAAVDDEQAARFCGVKDGIEAALILQADKLGVEFSWSVSRAPCARQPSLRYRTRLVVKKLFPTPPLP
jgi:hypothetical protein